MIFIELRFITLRHVCLKGEHAYPSHDVTRDGLGASQRSLQYLHRNRRAGLGIGQCMVVVKKVVPAGGGDGLELMVGETASEMSP